MESIILFDGVCNLCNGFVQFIIKNDKKGKFKFASLQSSAAKELLNSFHFHIDVPIAIGMKTLVLVENGKIYLRSRAVLRVARQLDGLWKISLILYIFPSFISDAVYNLIAGYRYKIFGMKDSCMTPLPDLNSRFLM